jgi:hypothetical protein
VKDLKNQRIGIDEVEELGHPAVGLREGGRRGRWEWGDARGFRQGRAGLRRAAEL